MKAPKPCPFCGEQPTVSTLGSMIDIECCVSMSIQKSDELTIRQRNTWSNESLTYSPSAEAKALNVALEEWNTRSNRWKQGTPPNDDKLYILNFQPNYVMLVSWCKDRNCYLDHRRQRPIPNHWITESCTWIESPSS